MTDEDQYARMVTGDGRARREWSGAHHHQIRVVDLNTMRNPQPHYRDELPKIRCSACGNTFLLSDDMMKANPEIEAITRKHLELCEGDAAVTLWKIDQAYKAGEFRIP